MLSYAHIIVMAMSVSGLALFSARAAEPVPAGIFINKECIDCHQIHNPKIIEQFNLGPHAGKTNVGCISCHGSEHLGASQKARQNNTCTGCHEGAESHSYSSSKHGVIMRLESKEQNWQLPLQRGNYRVPGCSYCHLHDNNHGNSMKPESGRELTQSICGGCHSARYIRELMANGERQLSIADLKVKEGMDLIQSVDAEPLNSLSILSKELYLHRRNVLLGVGHQSPDYQWWHGQPALDGDLIRIRDVIAKRKIRKIFKGTSNNSAPEK